MRWVFLCENNSGSWYARNQLPGEQLLFNRKGRTQLVVLLFRHVGSNWIGIRLKYSSNILPCTVTLVNSNSPNVPSLI